MFKFFLFISIFSGTAKIAFLHHGNQSFSDNGAYTLRPGDEGYNGNSFHRTLDTHEYYNVPLDIHISGPLTESYSWMRNDNGLLNRLKGDLVYLVGGSYAENILPYVDSTANKNSFQFVKEVYDSTIKGVGWPDFPTVIWIPERVFKSENLMPYSLIKLLNEAYGKYDSQGHYLAPCIVLDDNVHEWYYHTYPDGTECHNSRKVHIMYDNEGNYVFVVFIQKVARDQMVWNDISNPNNPLHQLLEALSNDPDQEQIVIYGDDWEKAAGVAGWDFGQAGVPASSYDHNISYIASQNWIQPVHTAEAVKWWGVDKLYDSDPLNDPPSIQIDYAAYQELHDWTGGTYDNWYDDFKNTQAWGCENGPDLNGNGVYGDYEDLWKFAYEKLLNVPSNEISRLGWITLMGMLYETAWHTGPGGELVYWGKNVWNHTRYGGIFAFGSVWYDSLRFLAQADVHEEDLDGDGVKEYALYNDRICFIFDRRGGRALAVFTSDGKTVIGNLMSYWGGEGDFNDGGHPGGFNDTQGENSWFTCSYGQEGDTAYIIFNEVYDYQGNSSTDLIKEFRLTPGKNFVEVHYNSRWENWTKSGVTPDMYLNLLKGYSLTPVSGLSPNGWMYAGYMCLEDSTKAVYIWPSGEGYYYHNLGKMSSGAELIELGGKSGTYTFYFYAGKGTPDVDIPGPGDLEGPMIWGTSYTPSINIMETDSVLVTSYIEDPSGVASAYIHYGVNNNWNYPDVLMIPDDGNSHDWNGNGVPDDNLYGGYIPPQSEGSVVEFAIRAIDNSPDHYESWDNNNWQNYSYTVGVIKFIMDGKLDKVAELVAQNGDMHLYTYYYADSGKLYVATEAAGDSSTGGSGIFYNDHFIFVSLNPDTMVHAPWAKSGLVAYYDYYLADEDNNDFVSWFAFNDSILNDTTTFICTSASTDTGILEGVIDLRRAFGFVSDTIYLCVGSYGTKDGANLEWQVPKPETLDQNIDPDEYLKLPLMDSSGLSQLPNMPYFKVYPVPARSCIYLELRFATPESVELSLYNILGMKILKKKYNPVYFLQERLNLGGFPQGIYFLTLKSKSFMTTKKVLIIR